VFSDGSGGLTGQLLGGATVSNGALVFGPTGFAQLSGNAISSTSSFAVGFEVAGAVKTGVKAVILSQGPSGTAGFSIGYDDSGVIQLGNQIPNTKIAFPTDNEFHRYDLVSNSSGTFLSIDSKIRFVSTTTLTVPATGPATRFGASSDVTVSDFFGGKMKNVNFYSLVEPPSPASPSPSPSVGSDEMPSLSRWQVIVMAVVIPCGVALVLAVIIVYLKLCRQSTRRMNRIYSDVPIILRVCFVLMCTLTHIDIEIYHS